MKSVPFVWGIRCSIVALTLLPMVLTEQSQAKPSAPITGNELPICYLQTSDNRLINLSRLCQGPPATLNITSLTYKSNFVIGRVDNQSRKIARSVRVNYQVIDETGTVIDRTSVEVVPDTLQPGQAATFETFLPARSRLHQPYITWNTNP